MMEAKRWAAFSVAMLLGVLSAWSDEIVKVSAKDYDFLFTKEDLKLYGFELDVSGESESTTLKTYEDGSKMLKYSYDTLGKEKFTEMFFAVYVDYDKTEAKGKGTFRSNIDTLIASGKEHGFACEKAKPVIQTGDEIEYYLRKRNGEINGFLFSVRHGKVCYTILTSGLYNSDGSLFRDEIQARLKKLPGGKGN